MWNKVNKTSEFAVAHDVPANGNCGYTAVGCALRFNGHTEFQTDGLWSNNTKFRKAIFDEAESNWQDYLGNGNRSKDQREILKVHYVGSYEVGPIAIPYCPQTAGKGTVKHNVSEDRLKDHLTKEILANTYIEEWDFDRKGCLSKPHLFMRTERHLPIISKLYKTSIAAYCNPNEHKPSGSTYVCIYNGESGTVTVNEYRGLYVAPRGVPCILHDGYVHYNWLELK